MLALVLRLPWSAPPTADPSRGFAAAFGEHALCLAAAGDATPAGETPGGQADHDAGKCCQSHAAGGVVLPGAGAAVRIVFAMPADRWLSADPAPAMRSLGRAWARAPPLAIG